MRITLAWVALICAVACGQELGLTLGSLQSQQRGSGQTQLELGRGVALQANYGHKLWTGRKAALLGEVHLLANPQRKVTTSNATLTRDVASLFVLPGVRVKFMPQAKASPYLAFGAGWALFEHSLLRHDGQPNAAPRTLSHGVAGFGGGIDFKFWRFLDLRAEVRDFVSGSPAYNTAAIRGAQHNVVLGGGLVVKFGQ